MYLIKPKQGSVLLGSTLTNEFSHSNTWRYDFGRVLRRHIETTDFFRNCEGEEAPADPLGANRSRNRQ